jgi:predicted phage baseplate assembly protein
VGTLTLRVEGSTETWEERPTLLESGPDEPVFRVEVDDEGDATVVLGDGLFGLRPDETADVTASYRVGGGTAGNVAADTLTLPRPPAGDSAPWLKSVTNPLPAVGGRNPEPLEHARRLGPATFRKPLVAVTTADYQAAAQGFTDAAGLKPIQRANAAFRWTGSWLTVTLAVDPRGGGTLDPALRRDLLRFLDTRRLAGYDLETTGARYVPIELALEICVAAGFRPGDMQQAIFRALSSGEVPREGKGLFHPDRFTFGDRLYVSRIHAAVAAVSGVESVHITRLARFKASQPERDTAANLARGYLEVGADEIVRLDNDRNFPQNGTLAVRVRG